MFLVDRRVLSGAVNLAGRGDDDALGAGFAGRLKDMQRALDVHSDVGIRRDVRVGDADKSCQVINAPTLLRGLTNSAGIADVAVEDLQPLGQRTGNLAEKADAAAGSIAHHGADALTALEQCLD